MRAGPGNVYTQWRKPMLDSAEVPNFESLNPHITLVVNGHYALSVSGSEMRSVEDRRLSWIASESDISITRVTGRMDIYQFLVDSSAHINGASRTRGICGMLNGAPRCGFGAGISIVPTRRHVEGRVGLAKSSGDAH